MIRKILKVTILKYLDKPHTSKILHKKKFMSDQAA